MQTATTIKTSEATGAVLDWLVAAIEQENDNRLTVIRHNTLIGTLIEREDEPESYRYERWWPSSDWSQGGPIIEQEFIGIDSRPSVRSGGDTWYAISDVEDADAAQMDGPTPLIAAMRCYVASKMGDTVEVPSELV